MKINEEKLKEEIIIMKKSIMKHVNEKDKEYIGKIEKYNQIVVLGVAGFKCQKPKCKEKKNLQIHHLIMRRAKDFMDFWRYASQRYYWANQIVLCSKHHREYHRKLGKDIGASGENITKERIKEVKEFLK